MREVPDFVYFCKYGLVEHGSPCLAMTMGKKQVFVNWWCDLN